MVRTVDETLTSGHIEQADIDNLGTHFRGSLISPDDPTYEDTRKIWNAMINRRPGLIAMCSGVADIIAVVRFARERDLLISVRGGGTMSQARPCATMGW